MFCSILSIDRTLSGATSPQPRVDLGSMAMKRYTAFPKAFALLETHHKIVLYHTQDTCWVSFTPSGEMQSVYFTAPYPTSRLGDIHFVSVAFAYYVIILFFCLLIIATVLCSQFLLDYYYFAPLRVFHWTLSDIIIIIIIPCVF